jgi:hypothetical protein
MLDGDLLAYSSMAISPFTGLFLVVIYIGTIAPVARPSVSTFGEAGRTPKLASRRV